MKPPGFFIGKRLPSFGTWEVPAFGCAKHGRGSQPESPCLITANQGAVARIGAGVISQCRLQAPGCRRKAAGWLNRCPRPSCGLDPGAHLCWSGCAPVEKRPGLSTGSRAVLLLLEGLAPATELLRLPERPVREYFRKAIVPDLPPPVRRQPHPDSESPAERIRGTRQAAMSSYKRNGHYPSRCCGCRRLPGRFWPPGGHLSCTSATESARWSANA